MRYKGLDVYDNVNFSIILSRWCNASCGFCVEDLRNQSTKNTSMCPKLFIDWKGNIHRGFKNIWG